MLQFAEFTHVNKAFFLRFPSSRKQNIKPTGSLQITIIIVGLGSGKKCTVRLYELAWRQAWQNSKANADLCILITTFYSIRTGTVETFCFRFRCIFYLFRHRWFYYKLAIFFIDFLLSIVLFPIQSNKYPYYGTAFTLAL